MTFTSRHHTKNSCSRAACRGAFFRLCTLLTGLLPLWAGAADRPDNDEDRWFQVELILFAQRTGDPLEAEQWPDIEGLHLPEALLELSLPPVNETGMNDANGPDHAPAESEPPADAASPAGLEGPIAYQLLRKEALQLGAMVDKLRRSKNFEPLLHIAWQQPTQDRQHAQPIFIMEGIADPLPQASPDDEPSADMPTADIPPPEEDTSVQGETPSPPLLEYATEEDRHIGPPNPRIVGTVTLSVERYLHVAADLLYRRSVTQRNPIPIPDLELWYDHPYPTLSEPQGPAYRLETWQAMRGFQFKESRRMRSKEIHYLDHPFMGLIVIITPVELPEPAEAIQQTSPQNILDAPKKR